ncbi:MAG: electron transport complex subunit E [Acutalibacteraceae bacterium]|jgi:electron transport complex protein RnfE|nr:electron transport complex subunit E [Acutalibacteraceae bacterium]
MAEKKTSLGGEFTKGLIRENPVLVIMLGTCPTLAISTNLENSIGMGIAATIVLFFSNIVISMLRKVIPDKVRIPCFIVVIAAFVSIIQMFVKAFAPSLDAALGIYLPLIVVNCIILGRAEAFASKNNVLRSAIDGLGMGVGFTLALALMAIIREFFGSGNLTLKVLGHGTTLVDICHLGDGNLLSAIHAEPILFFVLAPGGFFVYGLLIAISNSIARKKGKGVADINACYVCENAEGCMVVADGENAGTIVIPKPVVDTEPQVQKVEKAAPAAPAAPAAEGKEEK